MVAHPPRPRKKQLLVPDALEARFNPIFKGGLPGHFSSSLGIQPLPNGAHTGYAREAPCRVLERSSPCL